MALESESLRGNAQKLNAELYSALMREDEEMVIRLCQQIPEGPFHKLTPHDDTVIHMATYSKQRNLVIRLLELVDGCDPSRLIQPNDVGNTVLHEAATSNRAVDAAEMMLDKAPALLSARNVLGESPLFRAVRYGKNEMFELLAARVDNTFAAEDTKTLFQRNDGTTILHMAILAEHFELAFRIATRYEFLIGIPDEDDMTGLQLLACNASAFKSWKNHGFVKRFIYSRISIYDPSDPSVKKDEGPRTKVGNPISLSLKFVKTNCRLPLAEAIRKEKQRHESALKLAKLLIEKDTSWEKTDPRTNWIKPKPHKYGRNICLKGHKYGRKISTGSLGLNREEAEGQSIGSSDQGEEELEESPQRTSIVKSGETPLFLATSNGCVEIVEEILRAYPQAVEHINAEGKNVLHVAIRCRQLKVFEILEKMEFPMQRLVRKIDNEGNSVLHMVGIRRIEDMDEKIQSPAIHLQRELLLFERVKEVSTSHFVKHYNTVGKTAEELFIANSIELRKEAKEWLKRTSENCIIVAVLMATVAFAAAYTIPGGPNQSTGLPLLLSQPFFVVFTMADVISLTFALTSVLTFLSILTSPFQLKDFKHSLPQKLMLGFTFLILSVSMMMVAFAATIILMIQNKERWTKIALPSVAFLPVSIFVFSYFPLYLLLMETFMYILKKIGRAFPRCNCIPPPSGITNLFNWHKSQGTIFSKSPQSQTTRSTSVTWLPPPQTIRNPV